MRNTIVLYSLACFSMMSLASTTAFADVCGRSAGIVTHLEKALGKTCSSITLDDLSQTQSLVFDFTALAPLKKGDFEGFSRLKHLSLSECGLQQLPEGIFQGLFSLEYVNLDGNKISIFQSDLLQDLGSLKVFSAANNLIPALPENLFQNNARLVTIGLDGNQLEQLPPGLFQGLASLEAISLSSNKISHLPSEIFKDNSRLKAVLLPVNQITSVDFILFSELKSLRVLTMDNNPLKDFDISPFATLPALKLLSLHDTEFKTLQRTIPNNDPEVIQIGSTIEKLGFTIDEHGVRNSVAVRCVWISGSLITALDSIYSCTRKDGNKPLNSNYAYEDWSVGDPGYGYSKARSLEFIANCESHGGVKEVITVLSGTFETCRIHEDGDFAGDTWIGPSPQGYVKGYFLVAYQKRTYDWEFASFSW